MRILKAIIKAFKKYKNRNLTELELLERALVRTQKAIEKIKKKKGLMEGQRRICCPDCFYGQAFVDLCLKEERQQEWLDILKKKHESL